MTAGFVSHHARKARICSGIMVIPIIAAGLSSSRPVAEEHLGRHYEPPEHHSYIYGTFLQSSRPEVGRGLSLNFRPPSRSCNHRNRSTGVPAGARKRGSSEQTSSAVGAVRARGFL